MSLRETEFIEKFRDRGLWRATELYLRQPDAREFIEAATAETLAIIGIECFDEVSDMLHPRLDLIADFSEASLQQANDDARSFIESVPEHVLCSFTLADRG
jgi:hypothetical protein